MHEGIYIAASGAFKQERKLDVIANNLANLGNSGFKRDGLAFREMIPPFNSNAQLTAGLNPAQGSFPSDIRVSYVGVNDLYTDTSNGTLRPTGNALDVGLDGDGFFVVDTPQGQRYTRNGNFKLSPDGSLVTQEGHQVIGNDNLPIKIDLTAGGRISIDASGGISLGDGLQNIPVGNFKLVNFEDPTKLKKQGDGLLKLEGAGAGEKPPGNLRVQQGFLEASNVNAIEEMTNMIVTLRAFEAYQKVIQSIDQADDQAVNTIGRVA
ncbi:MAG: flagellar basal-body rod protein FlgF [Nitrospinaceae bacterium]|nr:MAG: flagellar basal-body rod protein FlgF [Nitrospinaceae bacterium]